MFRAAALLILLAALLVLLAACAPDPVKSPTVTNEAETGAAEQAARKNVKSPILGPRMFARDAEAINRDLSELEKQGRPDDPVELARFESDVRMKLRHIDVTTQALDVSIKAEAIQILQESYKVLLGERDKITKAIDLNWRDVVEIRKVLDAKTKGTGRIPAGMTEDELKDNMGDLEAKIHKLKEQEASVIARLEEKYEYRKNKTAPDQGATALTQERKVFVSLRARAEKLLQKS